MPEAEITGLGPQRQPQGADGRSVGRRGVFKMGWKETLQGPEWALQCVEEPCSLSRCPKEF